jgi:hypothetical protein
MGGRIWFEYRNLILRLVCMYCMGMGMGNGIVKRIYYFEKSSWGRYLLEIIC